MQNGEESKVNFEKSILNFEQYVTSPINRTRSFFDLDGPKISCCNAANAEFRGIQHPPRLALNNSINWTCKCNATQ